MLLLKLRCSNCSDRYIYQASGEKIEGYSQSDKHCMVCSLAVEEALKKIPKKFRKEWISSTLEDDAVWEMIHDYNKELEEDSKNGKFGLRRVFAGMYNTETGEYSSTIETKKSGKTFRITFWPGTKRIETVKESVEIEVATDKITGPWEL